MCFAAGIRLQKGRRTMFGNAMKVEFDGLAITLRQLTEKDVPVIVAGMSSLLVRQWTGSIDVVTEAEEREWLEKAGKSKVDVYWGIFLDGSKPPIGSTALHGIDRRSRTAVSGIVIWDPAWWRKGVATRAHLARTLFAADWLNLATIQSGVRVPNEASLKALQKVGYVVTGKHPRNFFAGGRYHDSYILTWFNPSLLNELWLEEKAPAEVLEGMEKAREALDRARNCVVFL
ncbi:GNAT family N-acetyltransferase [candidate division WWE3 bacterium]|nr:GNAT family N-acetyltransferase [candidate division WWE3 bacterium]